MSNLAWFEETNHYDHLAYLVDSTDNGLGDVLDHYVYVMDKYVNEYVGKAWNFTALVKKASRIVDGAINVVITDKATNYGTDLLLCNASTEFAEQTKAPLSVVISHELAETLVNPEGTRLAVDSFFHRRLLEVCDPVASSWFDIDDVAVSNFVLPSYFDREGGKDWYDHTHRLRNQFGLLEGSYCCAARNDDGTTLLFGDYAASNLKPHLRCQRVGRLLNKYRLTDTIT